MTHESRGMPCQKLTTGGLNKLHFQEGAVSNDVFDATHLAWSETQGKGMRGEKKTSS